MNRAGRVLRWLGITESPDDHRATPVWVPTTIAVFAMLGALLALAGDELVAAGVCAVSSASMLLLRRHLIRQRRSGATPRDSPLL